MFYEEWRVGDVAKKSKIVTLLLLMPNTAWKSE
jgi:hypothetical protein